MGQKIPRSGDRSQREQQQTPGKPNSFTSILKTSPAPPLECRLLRDNRVSEHGVQNIAKTL